MTAFALDIEAARRLALMEAWARRDGGGVAGARKKVARAVGLSASSLERVRRVRLKGVKAWVAERIRAAFVSALEAEIKALQHELDLALALGAEPRSDAAVKARAAIAEARALIGRQGETGR